MAVVFGLKSLHERVVLNYRYRMKQDKPVEKKPEMAVFKGAADDGANFHYTITEMVHS